MTLLDDYETRYKLHGVIVVQEMLGRIPKDVLKRTGVDGLIRQVGHSLFLLAEFKISCQSLRNSLSHLESLETPDLIKAAIGASVQLILQTTTVTTATKPSPERFDQLCSLLGEGIISGIWLYAEGKPRVVNATFEALPQLILALGMGTIRFLQVLQLPFVLSYDSINVPSAGLDPPIVVHLDSTAPCGARPKAATFSIENTRRYIGCLHTEDAFLERNDFGCDSTMLGRHLR